MRRTSHLRNEVNRPYESVGSRMAEAVALRGSSRLVSLNSCGRSDLESRRLHLAVRANDVGPAFSRSPSIGCLNDTVVYSMSLEARGPVQTIK